MTDSLLPAEDVAERPEDAALELDRSEECRLDELEGIIERGLETFIEVGEALSEIRAARLYRETHTSFQEYCRDRWGFTRQRAHQLIDAAKVSTIVNVENEAQARELAVLNIEDAQGIRTAWKEAERLAAQEGKSVTAAIVREAAKMRRRQLAQTEKALLELQFSPRGSWGRPSKPAPVDIPAALAASERAKAESDRIRAKAGLDPVPESNTVKAWRERLSKNGDGPAPRDLGKIVADLERLAASLPPDSPEHPALAKALTALSEVA